LVALDPNKVLRQKLIGKWEAADSGQYGYFHFKKDGRADIVVDGVSAIESQLKNQGFMRFQLNSDVQPMALDINAYSPFAEKIGTFKMIMEFVDDDTLRLSTHRKDEARRPNSFDSDDGDPMIFTRVDTRDKRSPEKKP